MKIYIVTGQTATGKTKYALQLAKKYNGELVNFDSRQIYKHLDIITGKDIHLLKEIPIWLYDIVDPKDPFSAHDFEKIAIKTIKEIISRGKTPILVGGTYFYLKYLLYMRQGEESQPDWELRNQLEGKDLSELQKMLQNENPEVFQTMNESDQNNPRRLIRKLELESQGKNLEQLSYEIILGEKLNIPNLEVEITGFFYPNRERLRQIIQTRVEERLDQGAIQEVENLLEKKYTSADYGLQTIGYQQVIHFLQKKISHEEMINDWVNKEVQYAKRQYTFMKKDPHIQWQTV